MLDSKEDSVVFVTGCGFNEIKQIRQAVKSLTIGDYIRVVYDTLPFGEEGLNPYTVGKITSINMKREGGFFRDPDIPEVWIDSLIKIRGTRRFNAVWYKNTGSYVSSGYYYPSLQDVVDKIQVVEFIEYAKKKQEQEAISQRMQNERIERNNSITEETIQRMRKDLDG